MLGVIFSYTNVAELAVLLAVCRWWQQAQQSMPRLQLTCNSEQTDALLERLRAPVLSRHVTQLVFSYDATQEDMNALPRVPTLTSLQLRRVVCGSLQFLTALPRLSELTLIFSSKPGLSLPATNALTALSACTLLVELRLGMSPNMCQLSSAQLDELLSHLPHLRSLEIDEASNIKSLSFLRRATQLQHLRLFGFSPKLADAELEHVAALQKLETLRLTHVFKGPSADAALYTPPSQCIPSLQSAYFFNTDPQ